MLVSICLWFMSMLVPAMAVDLREPISTIIPQITGAVSQARYFHEEVGEPPSAPIERFVQPAFYHAHIRPMKTSWSGYSPFFRPRFGWDSEVAQRLAEHQLTFDMSPVEIYEYRTGQRRGPLFQPIALLVVTDVNGRRIKSKFLTDAGIYLIKDFVRLYEEEMRLPDYERFRIRYKSRIDQVEAFKKVIDNLIGNDKTERGQTLTAVVGPEDLESVQHWLTRTRTNAKTPGSVKLLCGELLAQLMPVDKR